MMYPKESSPAFRKTSPAMLAKYKIEYTVPFNGHQTTTHHQLTNDPVACEQLLAEVLDRGFTIKAISHEGVELARSEADKMIKTAANILTMALVLFMAGRFTGTALMKWVKPFKLLMIFALADILLCAIAAFAGGGVGTVSLTLASFFMSVMFPTIFAGSIRGLGSLTKLGSSLIVMSIIGGAVLTALMGKLSDASGQIRFAMVIPLLCFIAVAMFARAMRGQRSTTA